MSHEQAVSMKGGLGTSLAELVKKNRGRSTLVAEIEKHYTTRDVAKIFEVHIATVRVWVTEGKIKSIRTPGGQYRIKESDLKAFAEGKFGQGAK